MSWNFVLFFFWENIVFIASQTEVDRMCLLPGQPSGGDELQPSASLSPLQQYM